ncbi:predicted protein [Chaetoceros tenuissimus]|uniref:Uncharacterized protein n=1 Tax=Chaetoceros tenuissimus TaxID=426638 RepID=A0AAD3D214_9STRA|nr:predicted protein [Chaetoceros tenuissimus]
MATLHSSCGTPHPRAMQHGQPPYHQYIAEQIVHHLKNVVLPKMIMEESFLHENSVILRQEQEQSSVCFVQSMVEGSENVEPFHDSTYKWVGLGKNAFRLLQFSPPTWKPPVKITLLQKESDFARLEIAKVLCADATTTKVRHLLTEVTKITVD